MPAAQVRPLYIPPPSQNLTESGYLILRDGTTATIRIAQPSDQQAMQTFIDRLSPESKRHRFFSEAAPPPELIDSLCDSSDPRSKLTLIVIRVWEGLLRIIAAGSYLAKDEHTAEVAMAVDDAFHGKGLGTLLLERLALLAIRHGFTRLWAVTHTDNLAMREVFRESGYDVRETFEGDDMEVELSVIPTETSVTRSEVRDRIATTASLRPLFRPRAVAVLGASRDPAHIGNRLVQALVTNRFQGPIYPINPKATEVAGLRAYPSVRDAPG
ncbi:MAG TPA: GNAT family N-acetyltransferase, partial [Nitrospiraceae bacterium]|nr:GNAT family N-acetyltransferase [Nitrospiraceae bacterium]